MSIINQNFIIWGAGNRGRFILDYCKKNGMNISAFIDSNPLLQGMIVDGCPVISFEDYMRLTEPDVIIVSPVHYENIVKVLQNAGVKRYLLYRDVALFAFDDGAEVAENEALHIANGDDGWERERASLLSSICTLSLSSLKYFWHMDLVQHEFSEKQELVKMSCVLKKLKLAKKPLIDNSAENIISGTQLLCGAELHTTSTRILDKDWDFDLLIMHGMRLDLLKHCLLIKARENDVPVVFEEDGFRSPHALTLQEHGVYINAMQPSYMERILESDWHLTDEEKGRACKCIDRIRNERLSKYKHQPLSCPTLGELGKEKVLIIDQVYGDKSIEYGLASDDTFAEMVETALSDKPTAEIYVKTHPASDKGHYGYLKSDVRVHFLCTPVNPIALLEQMDKVYVCASTMGFEALMCGCDTHVFGMPFYAGWGLTADKITGERRTKHRSLEEVFYVAYVLSSVYVSYETGNQCEIEQTMDELVFLRQKYFQKSRINA